MTGISFDWTINVGHISTALLVLAGWLYSYFQLKSDVRVVKHDLKFIGDRQEIFNTAITQLTNILTRVAVQDERLNSFEHRIEVSEKDIRDLQHGKGFITSEITGEYMSGGKIKHR